MWRGLVVLGLACLTSLPARADPARQVAGLVEKLKGVDAKSPAAERERAAARVDAAFDLTAFTDACLGSAKAKLTPAQLDAARRSLVTLVRLKGYPAGGGFFREGRATARAPVAKDGRTTVTYDVLVAKDGLTTPVGFVVGAGGAVEDVLIDGDSMAADFRNQIARLLAKGTPDELLARLAGKARDAESPAK